MTHRSKKKNPDRNQIKSVYPGLDIVIPVYGCFDLLKKCLEAIPDACGDIRPNVVVVDDAYPAEKMPEGLDQVISETPYHITKLRNQENQGFGMTCNRGFRAGGSEFVLFLNSDAIMLPNSIKFMVEGIKSDPTVSVVGPKLLFPEDSTVPGRPAGRVQHAGMEINIRGDPIHIFVGWSRNHPKVVQSRHTMAVTGAVFLTRREDFKAVNGFDPIWGLGSFEDVDYCFKQATRGKRTIYFSGAEGYHYVGSSSIAANKPYPLLQNSMTFKARWANFLRWTAWEVW